MGKHSKDGDRDSAAGSNHVGAHRETETREDASWSGGPVGGKSDRGRTGPEAGWQLGGRQSE